MKVFGDSAPLSALNTWPAGHEDAAASQATGEGEAASLASSTEPSAPARDSAESLLDLNVWSSGPAAAHQLLTSAAAPRTDGTASAPAAQAWTDHIFQPLL